MKPGYMDPVLYRRIIDEAAAHPVDIIPFFRGEATLHPDLVDLLTETRQKISGKIFFATNGTLFETDLAARILPLLDFLSFSIDSVDKNPAGDSIRFDASVTENILNAVRLRAKMKARVVLQVSAVEGSLDDESAFIDFWKKRVDRVRIYRRHSENGRFGSQTIRKETQRIPCEKVFNNVVVYWDGEAGLCNHDWNRQIDVGNVRHQKMSEIWNGKRYADIRHCHHIHDYRHLKTCLVCAYWDTDPQIKGRLFDRKSAYAMGGI